ncbi:hypothetical protein PGTUg99_003378 [Puccinia graminis f. sp. tritici]|uniref:Uncharacterized protein n=1 Tax=Puccinia graminis f. sp. tritici TaxID=56615 RepID=A0A5B0N8V8_PUCGR|nr:hypothetical protein PGTUg99_007277 [Puccinia graminis f. sp. tritici]KAA1085146.1 hypothetical protein PGTUg99_001138 [Puccinia graminis f. sp. tritici]KAA1103661.1 hypothetical protein PGTUg99_006710 [Puccinia graminis f. sp. tritici]KAA1115852.1 hypothetical protein PGTUg99_001290 [Puccinia graminis f. sp. tritici]KAA1127613.1 hypothetical protein PGTUg99_003378 [Puccinia graminis f. sp. tritici]
MAFIRLALEIGLITNDKRINHPVVLCAARSIPVISKDSVLAIHTNLAIHNLVLDPIWRLDYPIQYADVFFIPTQPPAEGLIPVVQVDHHRQPPLPIHHTQSESSFLR